MFSRTSAFLCGILSIGLLSIDAAADQFDLKGGGQLEGELLNGAGDETSVLEIRTSNGGKILLSPTEVLNVEMLSPAQRRYRELLPQMPDTVEGLWKMAEWCRENRLKEERNLHLEQILERDPEHKGARAGLGYTSVGGQWVITNEWKEDQGFVRDGSTWKLPQELLLDGQDDGFGDRVIQWKQKVKIWRGQLNRRNAAEALNELRAVDDPAAAEAYAEALEDEPNRELRKIYIGVLGKMTVSSVATTALARHALEDVDEQVRDAALDELAQNNVRAVVTTFIRALEHDDNLLVNRAAIGLSRMNDKRAIVPLINALITEHKRVATSGGGGPGQLGAGFGGQGAGGLSVGGSTKVVKVKQRNQAVYQALAALTGANFLYDQDAWRRWYSSQNAPEVLNLRRDD